MAHYSNQYYIKETAQKERSPLSHMGKIPIAVILKMHRYNAIINLTKSGNYNKKALYIVVPILMIALSTGIYLGVTVINSPEYALIQIANDIEESVVNGSMPYFTDQTQDTVSAITSITENNWKICGLEIPNLQK